MANLVKMNALRIDLESKKFNEQIIEDDLAKNFIGGAGIASLILFREVEASTQPFSSANLLIFSTGPFQSMKMPGSAKFSVCTKSPLTNGFTDSAAGGGFGVALKRTGFDFLVIKGKSESPVYLFIKDKKAFILPADELWGKDTIETYKILSKKHPGASVAAIGPAGEQMVAMACIYVDGYSAVGRGGTGGVMGSKNLKAIVALGSLEPPVFNRANVEFLEKKYRTSIAINAVGLREYGTVGGLVPGEESGNLPLKNWSQVGWKQGAEQIGYPGYSHLNNKLHPCKYCSLACHRSAHVTFPDGYSYDGPSPEYETLAMLGANCLINDLEILVKANDLCNRNGLDTMSVGGCAGFALEALEKGHTNGSIPEYPFSWGNGEGLLAFIEEISNHSGFGGIFSDGIRQAASKFKPEAVAYANHVKGQDIPAHDPRVYYNLALSYATGNRGACHMRAYSQIATMGALLPEAGIDKAPAPDTLEGSAFVVKTYQDFTSFYNACVQCQFMIWGGLSLTDMAECLNAVTGWEMTTKDIMKCGERIFTVQRLLNNKWGISSRDDTLPERFFEPSKSGPRAGKAPKKALFKKELAQLYKLRGWDENGIVTESTIKQLGLDKWI